VTVRVFTAQTGPTDSPRLLLLTYIHYASSDVFASNAAEDFVPLGRGTAPMGPDYHVALSHITREGNRHIMRYKLHRGNVGLAPVILNLGIRLR
jgi:hypothetical protein